MKHLLNRHWRAEIRRLVILLFLGSLFGALGSTVYIGILFALSGYIGWFIYQLSRFEQWLAISDQQDPPESSGIWGQIFDKVYALQKHTRQAHDELRTVIKRMQASANALNDGVILVNANASLEWWNKAASRLMGFRFPEDTGQTITHLVRDLKFIRYFESGAYSKPIKLESPGIPGLLLEIQITQFGQDDRLLLVRDISELHHLEQVRTDFIGNVSHELRTPLTVLHGYLETFQTLRPELPPVYQKGITHMFNQAARMQALLEDLLLLSRLERPEKQSTESVDVVYLLKTIQEEARMLDPEKQLTILLDVQQPFYLLGNAKDLHSAFINLVSNAVKYSKEKGTITLKCGLMIGSGPSTNDAFVLVKDEGIGIEAKHLPRITERFYRVDSSRATSSGGTGLGLAIVKHALLRHDAKLLINSKPGQGSEFSCLFPAKRVSVHQTRRSS